MAICKIFLSKMEKSVMPDSDPDTNIEWHQFIEECLRDVQPFPFEVEYEALTEIKPSALTYLNLKLLERASEKGFSGIVISVCDYTREMLAFSFARALKNIRAGSSTWDFKTTFPKEGELVSAGKIIGKYLGVKDMNDGFGLRIKLAQPRGTKRKKEWITNYIALKDLPTVQPAPEDSTPTTERKTKAREAREAYSGLPSEAKRLVSLNPTVTKSVALATSSSPYANIPPTMLKRALLIFEDGNVDINECLKTARLVDGDLKTSYNYEATGQPSLIVTGRTSQGFADIPGIYDYLEEGGAVDILVIEAPSAECLDENKGFLEDIIEDYGVPVVVFCEESVLRQTPICEDLGFPVFIWGNSSISDVMRATAGTNVTVTHREKRVTSAIGRVRTVQDEGEFTKVAEILYSLSDKREVLSERDESALLSLINVFGQALKRTEMLIESESKEYWSKVDDALGVLTESSLALTETEIVQLREACNTLKTLCRPGITLPKEDAVFEAVSHAIRNARHRVCLIVAKGASETAATEYWESTLEDMMLPKELIRVVTPRTFLKQERAFEDEEVFISGWFRREEMERLLNSGLSNIFTVFLYKSCSDVDLENRWYTKAESYWKRHHAVQNHKAHAGMSQLRITPPKERTSKPVTAARNVDDSLPGIARTITRDYAQSQRAKDEEESCAGRLVWFTSGARRWLRVNDSGGDTLLVVTGALEDDEGEGFCRKTALALQDDDVVLRTESDDDALGEACKEFGSYEQTMALAHAWYKPIEEAKANIGRAAIIKKIQQSGCPRNRLTIANWVDDKVLIAPSERSDIEFIGKAHDSPVPDERLDAIIKAGSIILGERISSGRRLAKDIAATFVREARECGSLEEAATAFKEKHSDMGAVELLYVDYVSETEIVPVGRFGWYLD